jgi:acetyl-CoA synthetase
MAPSAAEVLSADVFNGWKASPVLRSSKGWVHAEVLHIYLPTTRAENPAPLPGCPAMKLRSG